MSAHPVITKVESIIVSLPRETPYLGPLGAGEKVTERGYVVRGGNRTLYPTRDSSVLVKLTAEDGTIGWGETYGIIAPQATAAIIDDVLGPLLIGRDPRDVTTIGEDFYDLMRVRGHFGGYFIDAIAAPAAPAGLCFGAAGADAGAAGGGGRAVAGPGFSGLQIPRGGVF
jgi:galactonate dehydratase